MAVGDAKYVKVGDKAERFHVGDRVGKCPDCGRPLVVREGRFGKFVGCEGFKAGCRKTYRIDNFRVYIQHYCDVYNLREAEWGDLAMVEHIIETNKALNFRACGIRESIIDAMWM